MGGEGKSSRRQGSVASRPKLKFWKDVPFRAEGPAAQSTGLQPCDAWWAVDRGLKGRPRFSASRPALQAEMFVLRGT